LVRNKRQSQKEAISFLATIFSKSKATQLPLNSSTNEIQASEFVFGEVSKSFLNEGSVMSVAKTTSLGTDFDLLIQPPGFENLTIDEDAERFRLLEHEGEHCLGSTPSSDFGPSTKRTTSDQARFLEPMPPSTLPPIYPHGPLNLNPDGTTINYRKSYAGPNAHH
jgi:hypothetical protein